MSNIQEGSIVEIKLFGLIDHPGIVVYNGYEQQVIHNSFKAGKVIMSPLSEFMDGHKLHFSTRYRSRKHPALIAQSAYSKLGKQWTPFYNCQHFVSDVAGLKPNSHDMNLILLLVGLGTLGIALRR